MTSCINDCPVCKNKNIKLKERWQIGFLPPYRIYWVKCDFCRLKSIEHPAYWIVIEDWNNELCNKQNERFIRYNKSMRKRFFVGIGKLKGLLWKKN